MTSEGTSAREATESRRPTSERPIYDDVSLVSLASTMAKHRRVTVGLPVLLAFLTAVVVLVISPTYTATTTFVPETSSQSRLPAGLAGIAGQFGISIGAEASRSPKFYAEVVRSRELMERVLLSTYADPRRRHAAGDSATLLQILQVAGRDPAKRLHKGIKKVGKLVSVSVNNQTNIVSLSVDSHYPVLAAAVANKFVEYLNAFNTQYRQSQARERRRFVEQRLADGERELRSTEAELRSFFERNRSWQQSPQLTFEEGRLRRQVEIRQDLYMTLRREYETSRIEEVNDTPVITVVDTAIPPAEKSKPKRALLVVIALVLGTMLGAFWAAGAEYLGRARRERDPLQ